MKKYNLFSFENVFLFLFLVAFPFGQIIRFSFNLRGMEIPLLPIDIIAGCAAIYAIFTKQKIPHALKYLLGFLSVAAFSFLLSCFVFKSGDLIYGLFYLIRLSAYIFFFVYIWNFAKKDLINKKLLMDSLLGVSIASAVFGWIQFFLIPSIKAFFVYGWDMHTFRLVGTFLDPTFLGLIIVFGLIISINQFIISKNKKLILIILFLLISLAFTYSRASYVAFIGVAAWISYKEKLFKQILFVVLGLIVLVLLLPTARNHSIELTRTFSIFDRLDNYKETAQIIKKFPVFGVGFDNLCLAKNKYISIESFSSHSCSGSDSSLLFMLATTGIVGFLIFMGAALNILSLLSKSMEAKIFIGSMIALLIHSLFSNSMFYPWIMGFVFVLLVLALKE